MIIKPHESLWARAELPVRLSKHARDLLKKLADYRNMNIRACAEEMLDVFICDEAKRVGILREYNSKDGIYD